MKIAIVIQGPSLYVNEVKNAWKNHKEDIIFSTWIGSEKEYVENDNVIFNKYPSTNGHWNFNYQKISSYNGLLKAKELGYTHAIKVRSDYLPTNDKNFVQLLDFNKINVMCWHYTTFLWLKFPTFNGYISDHLMAGPINEMIELWNIKDNFCSAQTVITWSYINKLSKSIDINYFLTKLDEKNDLFYIKFNSQNNSIFGFNSQTNEFGEKILWGRYDSVYKNHSEYTKAPEETKKYMNDNYLNFLKYYTPLPKITILNTENKDFKDIIYPQNKLEIISDENNITGDFIITSDKITSNSTIMIEYFKKINSFYDGITQNYHINNEKLTWDNPGNYNNYGYNDGDENISNSDLQTKEEFFWNPPKTELEFIDLDFLKIGTSNNNYNDEVGIFIEPIKEYFDKLPNKKNILKIKKIITGDKIINTKIKLKEEYVDLINIGNFLKEKKINKIKYLQINMDGYNLNIMNGLYDYIYNLEKNFHPKIIKFKNDSSEKEIDDIINLYFKINYKLISKSYDIIIKKIK